MIGWNRYSTRSAEEDTKDRLEAMMAADANGEYCQGNIQLEIKSFESFYQINRYTRYLSTIKNLKLVSESWTEDEGLKIIVSVQVPMALACLLEDMPEVASVCLDGRKAGSGGNKKGCQKMLVEMKTTEAAPEPVLV
jgi:molybdopterin/thiamine biosynthesis adenylyltransferase